MRLATLTVQRKPIPSDLEKKIEIAVAKLADAKKAESEAKQKADAAKLVRENLDDAAKKLKEEIAGATPETKPKLEEQAKVLKEATDTAAKTVALANAEHAGKQSAVAKIAAEIDDLKLRLDLASDSTDLAKAQRDLICALEALEEAQTGSSAGLCKSAPSAD